VSEASEPLVATLSDQRPERALQASAAAVVAPLQGEKNIWGSLPTLLGARFASPGLYDAAPTGQVNADAFSTR